jgi:ribosomal protein L29
MKKKDIQELKNRSVAELERVVKEGNERLRVLKFDLAAGKVKNVRELHETRKKVARAKTFLNQSHGNTK